MPRVGIGIPIMGIARTVTRGRHPRTSLADALFSTTQQRVLGLVFGQPDRSFYLTELITMIGAGSGVVQRDWPGSNRAGW